MSKNEIPLMTVREFRARFSRLTQPVRVIRSRGKVEILGLWTPTKRTSDVAGRTGVRYADEQSDKGSPERSGRQKGA